MYNSVPGEAAMKITIEIDSRAITYETTDDAGTEQE